MSAAREETRARPAVVVRRVGPEAAEQVMNRRTRDLAELDAQLEDPDLYVKNPAKVAELTKRRDNAKSKLDEAEEAWMALAEELADAEA